jgi:hypothetical protein
MIFSNTHLAPCKGMQIQPAVDTFLSAAPNQMKWEHRFGAVQQVAFPKTLNKRVARDDHDIMKTTLDNNAQPGAEYSHGQFCRRRDQATDRCEQVNTMCSHPNRIEQ